MSYNISSERFKHPLLKPILIELSNYFNEMGVSFFVIGATARDIIMELNDESSGRLTYDLDIAITIDHWDKFELVEAGLQKLENFSKDPKHKQRFKYLNRFDLDIVPFGNIMNQDHKIFWPPDESFAMSVLGFPVAQKTSIEVAIDHEIKVNIASLTGIAILKIVAWNDRHKKTNKDADDLAFIIQNFLEIHRDESIAHYETVYTENFTTFKAGATLLGIKIGELLKNSPDVKKKIWKILENEVQNKEKSILLNQILETHRILKFEEIYKGIYNLKKQLN